MGVLKNQSQKRKRPKLYWNRKGHVPIAGDPQEAIDFVNRFCRKEDQANPWVKIWSDHTRYDGQPTAFMKPSTFLKAVNKGFIDTKSFLYVNYLYVYSETKNGQWNRDYRICGSRQNVVLDIDKHKRAFSIEAFWEFLKEIDVELPYYTSHTSERSMHLVYSGTYDTLSDAKITEICCKIAGIENPPEDPKELERLLKRGGVDPNSIVWDRKCHKVRIPGTVNMKGDTPWVVKGKFNPDYPNDDESIRKYLGSEGIFYSLKQARVDLLKDKSTKVFWKKRIPKIEMVLRRHFGKQTATELAEFLAIRFGWLSKGVCTIRGADLASFMGWGQQYASTVLRKLRKHNIIEMTKEYYFEAKGSKKNRARDYGLGDVTRAVFDKSQDELPKPKINLTLPYESGETWEQMSKDIRDAYMAGAKTEDIVEFCLRKQQLHRPRTRWRSKSDIKYMVGHWARKFNPDEYYRSPECVVDLEETIRMMEEGSNVEDIR